jgi:competence protein ComEA
MEGNVMKHCLLKIMLLIVICTAGLVPTSLSAAENPTVKQAAATINLNQATAEELQSLPGVGPALSERIIKYRTEYGPFRSVDQLTEVQGVGQAKLARFKDRLKLD